MQAAHVVHTQVAYILHIYEVWWKLAHVLRTRIHCTIGATHVPHISICKGPKKVNKNHLQYYLIGTIGLMIFEQTFDFMLIDGINF